MVQAFIGTDEYKKHKEARFVGKDKSVIIAENAAFNLSDKVRERFTQRFKATSALYYNGQPEFEELLYRIKRYIAQL